MNIQLQQITIRELAEGFIDDAEGGVRGYGGRLNIRPAYQREFVYKDKQRDAVLLIYGEGLSHAAAGEVLGCAETTISWHVHEARKRLKVLLRDAAA